MTQPNLTNIVVIGKSGQLAWELAQLNDQKNSIICLGRNEIDITCKQSILDTLKKHHLSQQYSNIQFSFVVPDQS